MDDGCNIHLDGAIAPREGSKPSERSFKVDSHRGSLGLPVPIGGGPKVRDHEAALTHPIIRLAAKYGRYGDRRIRQLLVDEAWDVSVKRRIWRRKGAQSSIEATQARPSLAQ